MEKIQDIISNNKGDVTLYRIIFNILTDTNTIKNYTNNSNGIFFNMNSFDNKKIQEVYDNVNSYIDNKKELEKLENNRETIMKELSKTIDNSYKTELKDLIDTNKKNKGPLSTHLDNEIVTPAALSELEQEKLLKRKNNIRMKKSIENYQKPIIYKGSFERIRKVLNQSKSTRSSKNTSIEESDKLYSSCEESIYDSSSETEQEQVLEPIECEGLSDSDQEQEETKSKEKDNDIEEDLFGYDSDN